MRPARDTALVLAVVLKRSGRASVRLSDEGFLRVASPVRSTQQPHNAVDTYVSDVRANLREFGFTIVALDHDGGIGGYALLNANKLQTARCVTPTAFLTNSELEVIDSRGPEDPKLWHWIAEVVARCDVDGGA